MVTFSFRHSNSVWGSSFAAFFSLKSWEYFWKKTEKKKRPFIFWCCDFALYCYFLTFCFIGTKSTNVQLLEWKAPDNGKDFSSPHIQCNPNPTDFETIDFSRNSQKISSWRETWWFHYNECKGIYPYFPSILNAEGEPWRWENGVKANSSVWGCTQHRSVVAEEGGGRCRLS